MSQARASFGGGTQPDTDNAELIAELRDRLTEASIKCSERCLYHSAKWAAEMLNSLPEQDEDNDSHMFNADGPQSSYRIFSTSYDDVEEASLEFKEAPKYLLAKSFFDTKEFDRCAAVFLPPTIPAGGLAIFEKAQSKTPKSSPSESKTKQMPPSQHNASPFPRLSQKSLFLALYARYIASEKRKEEETEMVLGPADGGQTVNRELPALARSLEAYFRYQDSVDPDLKRSQGWLEYLYGVILVKSKQEQLAQQWLLRSVRLNPYHWGAWDELASLLSSVDDLNTTLQHPRLPQNIMTLVFQTHAYVDLFSNTNPSTTVTLISTLLSYFPTSTFLQTLLALSHYHAKDFDTASSIFSSLLTLHPHRLDALDHYSNILYVLSDRPKLAFLAHLATAIDKFRPETCCVVGNYYSLCSQHEKAVMYFRRALTLDRNFLSAWTLMGHEYIELKNTHAAIESYRRAVDVNRKDYRAWYGLGQAYEVLDMGFYALFYYQRAAGLRPYDPKMWQAVGSCYAKMNRLESAIKALKRALVAGTYFETTESPSQSFNPAISVTSTASAARSGRQQQQSSHPAKKPTGRKLLDPETLFQIATIYERINDEISTAKYMDLCVAQETGASSRGVLLAEKRLRRRAQREARKAAQEEEKKRYRMERQMARAAANTAQESNEDIPDDDTDILTSSPSSSAESSEPSDLEPDPVDADDNNDGFGTGTTGTTSRARLWLARYAWKTGDLEKCERLAEELCVDGFEVEEAKGLGREVRARREGRLDED